MFFSATDRFVEIDGPNGFFGALNANSGSWSSPGIGFEEVSGTFRTFNQTPQWLVWSNQFCKSKCVLSTCAAFPNCTTMISI
jgi:hypothetical protein